MKLHCGLVLFFTFSLPFLLPPPRSLSLSLSPSSQDNHYHPEGSEACLLCECYPVGSFSRACERESGQCQCKPGVIGRQCDHCDNPFAEVSPNGCEGQHYHMSHDSKELPNVTCFRNVSVVQSDSLSSLIYVNECDYKAFLKSVFVPSKFYVMCTATPGQLILSAFLLSLPLPFPLSRFLSLSFSLSDL